MSAETTDPTAGERDECHCPPNHAMGFTFHERPCRFAPVEADAGEVDLATVIYNADFGHMVSLDMSEARIVATAILASDWLAALLDRERREVGECIAQAIKADRSLPWNAMHHEALRVAARIARESS